MSTTPVAPAEATGWRRHFAGLWHNPDFMKLWTGQTVSELCSRITRDGLPFTAVVMLGATPAQMGYLSAASAIPVLLTGLFAGVWVDRLRRRPLLIAADVGRALVLASIPVAALLGSLTMLQLTVALAAAGVLTVLFDTAYEAYLPALVERENILEGNSKLALSGSIAEVGGPGLAGLLIQAFTAPIAIALDALSFVFSAVSLVAIRKPEPPPRPAEQREHILREAGEGLRVVMRNPVLRAFALHSATSAFFGNFIGVLYALFAVRTLGFGAAALGLTIAMGGVSDIAGSLLATRVTRRFGLGRTLLGASVLGGITALFIPLAGGPPAVALGMMMLAQLLGDGLHTIGQINETSLRQAITPDHLLGRTGASINLLASSISPVGALAGGLLATAVGVRQTLLIAVAGLVLSSLWLVFSPVRDLQHHPEIAVRAGPAEE